MSVSSLESWECLKTVPCVEFRQFETIFAPAPASFAAFVKFVDLKLFANASVGLTKVAVRLSIDVGEWRNPWSVNAFIAAMENAVAMRNGGHEWTKSGGWSPYGFDFDFIMPIAEPRSSLGHVAGTATTVVRTTVQSVSAQLQNLASVQFPTVAGPDSHVVVSENTHHPNDTRQRPPRGLAVFLCHASEDKESARVLYTRLLQDGFDPWLDEANLLPGQEWGPEIARAVRETDVVVVCLSSRSIDKKGYVQREIRLALDAADDRPVGSIFVIPSRIEDCRVPERLSRWQRVDLFAENGYERLLRALDSVRLR